jgi:hypothetical protein
MRRAQNRLFFDEKDLGRISCNPLLKLGGEIQIAEERGMHHMETKKNRHDRDGSFFV